MITYAANLYGFTVEEEALVDVETKAADAERRLVAIDNSPALLQLRNDFVNVRTIVGPKRRRRNLQCLAHVGMRALCGDGVRNGPGNPSSISVLNQRGQIYRSSAIRTVTHLRL